MARQPTILDLNFSHKKEGRCVDLIHLRVCLFIDVNGEHGSLG